MSQKFMLSPFIDTHPPTASRQATEILGLVFYRKYYTIELPSA